MIKFYTQHKQVILSILVLTALVSSFAFPSDGFARNFLLGLAAGTALVFLMSAMDKTKAKNQKEDNAL